MLFVLFLCTCFTSLLRASPTDTAPAQALGCPTFSSSAESSQQESMQLEVNGESVGMEELGPIIINEDGTMRRITNWHLLNDREKASSWKVIKKRNAKRIETLKTKQAEQTRVESSNSEHTEEQQEEVLLLPEGPSSFDSSRKGEGEGDDEEKGRTTTRSMF